MQIAFLQTKDWEEAYIREKLASFDFVEQVDFYPQAVDEIDPTILSSYQVISPFIHSPFTRDLLQQLPNLKCIATRSTGFDHVDLHAAGEQGIVVSNVPSYGVNTVAEQAFALLLSISRKIPQSLKRTKQGNFDRDGLQGFDLAGKTIGIVGTGRIGFHTAKIAHGFGMKIIGYDPYPNEELKNTYGVEYMELTQLLAQADVISLHVPYMKETHHLLNAETMQHIKKGAVLINTARGALVDNDALIDALHDGRLAAAGLDVVEGEEYIEDELALLDQEVSQDTLKTLVENHVLLAMPNVMITPHNAFNTREALMRIIDTTLENINAFHLEQPQNVVQAKV